MTTTTPLIPHIYEKLPMHTGSMTDKSGMLWVEKNGLPLDKPR
jgi:hypothetical protein